MRRNDKIYFIVTGAVAAAALLFFILNGNEKLRYRLPGFPSVQEKEVTRIEITSGSGEPLVVEKSGDEWRLPATGHRADPDRISQMLTHVLVTSPVDLVSEIGNDKTYGFTGDTALSLAVYTGTKKIRDLRIGSVTPSGGYTYIRLGDGKKTYTLRGSLPALFGLSADDLRDKSVLTYDDKAIASVKFTGSDGRTETITRQGEGDLAVWTGRDGTVYETYRLDNIIFRYSRLKAAQFVPEIPEEIKNGESFTVEMNGPENRLTVYGRTGERLYAVSSQTKEPFLLDWGLAKWIFRLFVDGEQVSD